MTDTAQPSDLASATGPLEGLRVIDLTGLSPGQYATMLLGDLGADVITVEPPAARRAGSRPAALPGHGGTAARELGINPLFRSRRSIVLDLKSPGDLDVAMRLADTADAFVEGFRPGVCDRLGLGYEALSARNPRLVYCSITGYGSQGEAALRPGHDLNYIAEAGLLSVLARDEDPPRIPLNLVADLAAGGMVAAFGILAALRGRDRTGRGSHVDVSMLEGLLSMLAPAASWHEAGAPDASFGGAINSGAAPFYDSYRTGDGQWLAVAAMEQKFFVALCEALARPDLAPLQFDASRWPELRRELELIFASQPLHHWLRRLADVDTTVTPVRSIPEAFAEAHRSGIVQSAVTVGPIPRISGYDRTVGPVARRADQDRNEILGELATDRREADSGRR
ncbi:MAG TPA: CaiB/BaiF CoA-transferase family protein [Solirubrobacteraceae bacterium]